MLGVVLSFCHLKFLHGGTKNIHKFRFKRFTCPTCPTRPGQKDFETWRPKSGPRPSKHSWQKMRIFLWIPLVNIRSHLHINIHVRTWELRILDSWWFLELYITSNMLSIYKGWTPWSKKRLMSAKCVLLQLEAYREADMDLKNTTHMVKWLWLMT